MIIHSLLGGYRLITTRQIGLDKKDASLYALIVSFLCVWVMGGIVFLLSGDGIAIADVADNVHFLILGGVLFGVANLLTIRLFRLVNASVAILLTLLNNLAVVMLATLLGDETLSFKQASGIAVLLSSIVIAEVIAYRSKKKQARQARLTVISSIIITIVLSIIFSFAVLNEKYLLQELPLSTYVLFGWGAQFLAALLIFLLLGGARNIRGLQRMTHVYSWLSGLLLAVSGLLFVVSLQETNSSSQITVISSFKIVTAMLLAYVLLNERTHALLKMCTTATSVVGLFLLFS
jgi:uncharacterized membrane protein